MQQTLFTILTSKKARRRKVMKANLDREFSLGAPWLPKVPQEPLAKQQ